MEELSCLNSSCFKSGLIGVSEWEWSGEERIRDAARGSQIKHSAKLNKDCTSQGLALGNDALGRIFIIWSLSKGNWVMLWGKNCQVINCSRKDVFKEKVAVYRTISRFCFFTYETPEGRARTK